MLLLLLLLLLLFLLLLCRVCTICFFFRLLVCLLAFNTNMSLIVISICFGLPGNKTADEIELGHPSSTSSDTYEGL